jgi:hypothetical protein
LSFDNEKKSSHTVCPLPEAWQDPVSKSDTRSSILVDCLGKLACHFTDQGFLSNEIQIPTKLTLLQAKGKANYKVLVVTGTAAL